MRRDWRKVHIREQKDYGEEKVVERDGVSYSSLLSSIRQQLDLV